jgi:hypothetical protein
VEQQHLVALLGILEDARRPDDRRLGPGELARELPDLAARERVHPDRGLVE